MLLKRFARVMHKRLRILGVGMAVSLLLGSGLFALATDTIVSVDNELSSGEIATPSLDLKAALVPDNEPCDAAHATSDGPLPASVSSQVDLTGSDFIQGQDYCVMSTGSDAIGKLTYVFDNRLYTELGDCTPSEMNAEFGADASCGEGQPGELHQILQVRVMDASTLHLDCDVRVDQFVSFEDFLGQTDVRMGPGQVCRLRLELQIDPDASLNQRARAQTDQVQWDVTFSLEHVPDPA